MRKWINGQMIGKRKQGERKRTVTVSLKKDSGKRRRKWGYGKKNFGSLSLPLHIKNNDY